MNLPIPASECLKNKSISDGELRVNIFQIFFLFHRQMKSFHHHTHAKKKEKKFVFVRFKILFTPTFVSIQHQNRSPGDIAGYLSEMCLCVEV